MIFLVLYAGGRLPGVFAWPAGVGDVLVGLLAPVAAIVYARRPRTAAGFVRAWNPFGIADLIVAIAAGFLSATSPLQLLAFNLPNELISEFPLVLVPVFLVPLSIFAVARHWNTAGRARFRSGRWPPPSLSHSRARHGS